MLMKLNAANFLLDACRAGHWSQNMITGSLKITSDRWAPLVDCRSIGPWMMFQSERRQKESFNQKSKLITQMHGWDGLFDIAFQIWHFWLWNLNVIHSIAGKTLCASVGVPRSEAVALYDSKIGRSPVRGQLVDLALALSSGCDSEHETLTLRLAFTWLSILALEIGPSDALNIALQQLRLTSIEISFSQCDGTPQNFL